MACIVLPSKESNPEPNIPEIEIMQYKRIGSSTGIRKMAIMATRLAPKNEAKVPTNEMAPLVPFSTFLKFVINLGGPGFSTPNSVAQVSAFTAAIEAIKPVQGQDSEGKKKCMMVKMAAIPPLANTWLMSLWLPFSNFSLKPVFLFENIRDNILDEMKKVRRIIAHFHPPRPKMTVPLKTAPSAPLFERLLKYHAMEATITASRNPNNNWYVKTILRFEILIYLYSLDRNW